VRPAQSAYQPGQSVPGQMLQGQFGQGRMMAPVLQPPMLQPIAPRVDPARVDPERQRELQNDLVSWVKEQSRDWGTPGFEPTYPDLPEEPEPDFDVAPVDELPAAWPSPIVVVPADAIAQSETSSHSESDTA